MSVSYRRNSRLREWLELRYGRFEGVRRSLAIAFALSFVANAGDRVAGICTATKLP
jgi:hypothetical protein